MTAVRSARAAWSAGTRPKSSALTTDTSRLKTSARRSMRNASVIGKSVGISIWRNSSMPAYPTPSPMTPPAIAMSRLSVIS